MVSQSHGLGQFPVDGDAEAQFRHHSCESADHWCKLVRKALLGEIEVTRPGKRVQKTMERSTIFLMGKSTINGVCSIAMLNYQRVGGKGMKREPKRTGNPWF